MSEVKTHKRKPFGKSAENALNSKKDPAQKNGSKQDGRGGTSTTRFDPKATEKRRDSKTPKMGNLTSARDKHMKSAGHHPAAKLDPSPIKRPDPTTASTLHSTISRPGTKQRGEFVAASLKRLFPSKNSTINQPRAKTKSGRPIAPNPAHASSDMTTVRSAPEKDPPLVMSPLTKPDPIAKDQGGDILERVEENCMHVERNTKQTYGTYYQVMWCPFYFHQSKVEFARFVLFSLLNNTVDPDPKRQPLADGKDGVSPHAHPMKAVQEANDHPRSVPRDVLDRFRNGPADDKRVLDAMFKSGSGRTGLRHGPAKQEVSTDSLVGSIVGGRSDSADESEVTTAGYIKEDSSQASMTTRFDRVEADRGGVASYHTNEFVPSCAGRLDSVHVAAQSQSMFRGKIPTNAAPFHRELCRANAIDDRKTSEQSLARQTHLPAGWRVRWSKTKQQPYWVHPDFGSTWHCPGLIPNVGHATGRNELYDDQLIFEGMQIRRTVVANHSMAYNSALTSESDTVTSSHLTSVLQGDESSVKSTVDDYSMPKSVNANSQVNSNYYADDGEAGEKILHRGANATENLDVSSAEVSTKCFTQDFESHSNDEDQLKSATGCYNENEKQHDNDPVEFEHDQRGSHDDSDDGNNHRDGASQDSLNDQEDDIEETIEQENDDEDDGAIVLESVAESEGSSEINSLMSEYVDVDALLQRGGMSVKSPLATIEEIHQDSDGYQSSEASNEGSKLQNISMNLERSFEESSDEAIDFGATSGMNNEVPASVHLDSDEDGHESDSYEPRAEKKVKRNLSRRHGSKKKFFPPGPLCSLQFLEEIEKEEFDTPLWRRMKRKRSCIRPGSTK